MAYASGTAMKRSSKAKNTNSDQTRGASESAELPRSDMGTGKEIDQLNKQAATKQSLLELLDTWEPLDEDFPEIEDLPPEPFDF